MAKHRAPRKPWFPRKQRDRLLHPKLIDSQFKKLMGTVAGVFAFLAIMGTMVAPQSQQAAIALDPEPQQDDLLADSVLPTPDGQPVGQVYTQRRPVRSVAQVTRDIERTQPIAVVKYPARDKEEKVSERSEAASKSGSKHVRAPREPESRPHASRPKHRAAAHRGESVECVHRGRGPRVAEHDSGQADQGAHGSRPRSEGRTGRHHRADDSSRDSGSVDRDRARDRGDSSRDRDRSGSGHSSSHSGDRSSD